VIGTSWGDISAIEIETRRRVFYIERVFGTEGDVGINMAAFIQYEKYIIASGENNSIKFFNTENAESVYDFKIPSGSGSEQLSINKKIFCQIY